jgi:UDP-N-acetylmuramoylalanine--D-glutamate ligase
MDAQLIHNKKITVIGAARSGAAVAMLLKSQGANVFVSDTASADKLQSFIPSLQTEKIEYEVGGHSDRVYECDMMVISPGVPSNAPVILEAQKRKIKIVSELEVGSWFCRAPIVAITGSNGKTTTTTLTVTLERHSHLSFLNWLRQMLLCWK